MNWTTNFIDIADCLAEDIREQNEKHLRRDIEDMRRALDEVEKSIPERWPEIGESPDGVWYEWKPGWYADRLHAVRQGGNQRQTVCGFVLPHHLPENSTWFKNKRNRGVARCKKCERKL